LRQCRQKKEEENLDLFVSAIITNSFLNYREKKKKKKKKKKKNVFLCACDFQMKEKEKKSERQKKLKLARKIPNQLN